MMEERVRKVMHWVERGYEKHAKLMFLREILRYHLLDLSSLLLIIANFECISSKMVSKCARKSHLLFFFFS